MLPQEAIRAKRDGQALDAAAIGELVAGIADGSLGDAQIGALAMAIFLNGMNATETVALTEAVRDSGDVLDWTALDLPGPVIDKHSTGGVGDVVSLILGPWVAACGGHVPMISGRGLGHTGGTLDKLESIPGYSVTPDTATFRRLVEDVGVAIIGQTADLAPADKRLYAIRDVTATVESLPLIVSSILGKKLACGLDALVMDVKVGSGAFMPTPEASQELAETIAEVASRAGTPTTALLTDMSQPLAPCAGNALEVHEALAVLTGKRPNSRLLEVTRGLAVEMLLAGGLAPDRDAALKRLDERLASGEAAERFGRMVAGLGGPADLLDAPDRHLPVAPVVRPVLAPHAGHLRGLDTRALGMTVVELGGGRRQPGEAIDHAVGLADIAELGSKLDAGQPLATLHARSHAEADQAERQLLDAIEIGEARPSPTLIRDIIRREAP
ncbi:thymidine phosphorylase [Halomonas elongata]|uniref:Thymidine phosphorylase n=1 Tax=Halomonas elongata (strain ATCC 33173 / DSM 2581 / NBRC 15536 / NCIMB 2198 / 1H9) TaxID=768066 RepID=E1V589_HALED|nr:thymidine phosphorylase [Halomonas elongata]WBF16784.1 thymidine phosphorylase [Halomonas elongata]WPU45615.1 thymidine phosphorylase [Halomonas elongata DSM 2581]CBV43044.1 thymidine phosphorylase [Halomonas elongata DSM 2581]